MEASMFVRYESVPDGWKHPFGPYRQAPPEYGGWWWFTSPFVGDSPWLKGSPPREVLPAGFVEIFGPRPRSSDFQTEANPSMAFRVATSEWESNLKNFKQAGFPPILDGASIELATKVFEHWGMGAPRGYEGPYGWVIRFPESDVPSFEASAMAMATATHQTVAAYQVSMLERGLIPTNRHPFVPADIFAAVANGEMWGSVGDVGEVSPQTIEEKPYTSAAVKGSAGIEVPAGIAGRGIAGSTKGGTTPTTEISISIEGSPPVELVLGAVRMALEEVNNDED